MPVCAANMKSVVDVETCKFMATNGWFYIMHRFDVDVDHFISDMDNLNLLTSISIGINSESYNSLTTLLQNNQEPDYITVDVANAWSEKTRKMASFVKNHFPNTFLIIGNVATGQAVKEIETWGADAIKCGIAAGHVCITKNKTGVSRPMVSTILDCVDARIKVPIIADGGIIEHGDIAKALVCGADIVMAGSLFSGYEQSSGNIIEIEEDMYKEYYGSASKDNKKECRNIEGKKILIKFRGNMQRLLIELQEDLQSSISYLGEKTLSGIIGKRNFYILS
jgi:GMP reductase